MASKCDHKEAGKKCMGNISPMATNPPQSMWYQEILLSAFMIANPITPAANPKHKNMPNAIKQRLAHITSTSRT